MDVRLISPVNGYLIVTIKTFESAAMITSAMKIVPRKTSS